MKRVFASLAAIMACIIVLCLSACDSKEVSQEQPTPTVNEPEVSESDVSVPEVSGELHADITEDAHFKQFDIIYSFGNDEYENYMLWCEAEMTDFYIVNLHPDAKNWITDGVKIFEKEKISPNEAVNYIRMVPEGFPCDAVVYTANGEKYMYAVSYNGRDGGISLIPIDNLIVDPDAFNEETTTTTTTTITAATTTTTEKSEEIMIEAYWVNDDLEMFAREMTIESDSKWHVWRALKGLNPQIPSNCSLLSGEMAADKKGIMELDFSAEFKDMGTAGRPVLEAIANTFIITYGLDAVRFKVEGEYLESAICGYAEEFAYTEC